MNDGLHLSAAGAAFIKSFEACREATDDGRFKAYLCPAHVLTIGWGHTNRTTPAFTIDTVWTQAQCDNAFVQDMSVNETAVKRLAKITLDQNEFDALVSFAFNCGVGSLAGSTLLRKLNAGDRDGAALEFGRWIRAGGKVLPGLVKRRMAEALLFRRLDDIAPAGEPMVHAVTA
ncbi:MAG TPA: lysozyme [Rhizomicrobium sp.]|jgi:lysozyme|nr:lysozyme [Rhizomicrobium sp.]